MHQRSVTIDFSKKHLGNTVLQGRLSGEFYFPKWTECAYDFFQDLRNNAGLIGVIVPKACVCVICILHIILFTILPFGWSIGEKLCYLALCLGVIQIPCALLFDTDLMYYVCFSNTSLEFYYVSANFFGIPLCMCILCSHVSLYARGCYLFSWIPIMGWTVLADTIPKELLNSNARMFLFGYVSAVLSYCLLYSTMLRPFDEVIVDLGYGKRFLLSDVLVSCLIQTCCFTYKYWYFALKYPSCCVLWSVPVEMTTLSVTPPTKAPSAVFTPRARRSRPPTASLSRASSASWGGRLEETAL